jgi:hypothetical protein
MVSPHAGSLRLPESAVRALISELHLVASQIGLAYETAERSCAGALKSGWTTVTSGYTRLLAALSTPQVRPMSATWLARHEAESQKHHPDV